MPIPAVLITGGAGYIGSHAVLALLAEKREVIVVDNLFTGSKEVVPKEVPFYAVDIDDQQQISEIIQEHDVETVMHFAASISAPESTLKPLEYYQNNFAKTLTLLRACSTCNVRHLIFSSTAAVYGDTEQGHVDEHSPCTPISPYGASKLMAERALRDIAAINGINTVSLRYFNVAGADPDGRSGQLAFSPQHLIGVLIDVVLGLRKEFTIFGDDYPTPDGTCIRDYVHVCDIAAAHVQALKFLESQGGQHTFNCGYGKGYSVKEVLAACEQAFDVEIPVQISRRRSGDPAAVIARCSALAEKIGFAPQFHSIDTILRTALIWRKKQLALQIYGDGQHQ